MSCRRRVRRVPGRTPLCAKDDALSFCLRDTAAFPAALHLRHPLRGFLQSARIFPFAAHVFSVLLLRTDVRDRKMIPYFVRLRKTFNPIYAAVSSVMPKGEFYFCMTFHSGVVRPACR